jgi:nucleoid-associated protein YgaU
MMGLMSFVKEAGAYLFGSHAGAAVAQDAAKPVTVDILRQQIDTLGVSLDGLDVSFQDPVATVRGTVKSQSDRELVLLGLGNTPGVGQVDDQMTVAAGVPGAPAAVSAVTFYTVKKGDTLSAIAKAQYGNANKYPVIFEANKPMLKDPDRIYPGQVLRMPPKA